MSHPQDTPEPAGAGRWLGRAVRRPVTLFVTMAAMLVVSVIAYLRIPVEMMPSGMRDNGLRVIIPNPGASAQENEREVARVIEEQVRTLAGIEEIHTTASEDRVTIRVEYEREVDMDLAKAELRDRLERARPQLPDTVERIVVWSWDNDQMPLMWLALLHDDTERSDFLVEEVVKRRLEAVDGVSQAEFYGMLDDSVRILLDEDRVRAAGLDIGALIRRLSADNFASPLGEVEDGGRRVLVRSDMRFRSLEEIERYPIGNGQTIADVGEVARVQTVRDRLSRIDGQFAYFGSIGKESTANIVETAREVKRALEELEADPRLEGKLAFLPLFSQGDLIESSLAQLRSTALWGGLLAAVVLLVFLRRVRVTLSVALSIPVSALLALAWVHFTGGTFNVLTMTGITLGIGMLVDNSVVVIENISRLHARGRSSRDAAVEGVGEVGLAVMLATLTTVVVFLPLIFMSGNPIIRIMFGALGLPLCVSLLFSLLVALVFLPALAARILGPRHPAAERAAAAAAPIGRLPVALLTGAGRALGAVLGAGGAGLLVVARALLAVLTPLRWPLALGLLALGAWRGLELGGGLAPLAPLLVPEVAPAATRGPLAASPYLPPAAALLGALLLAFGTPVWRRLLAGGAAWRRADRTRTTSASSLVELAERANRALLGWSLSHRLLASGLALLAFLSWQVPLAKMTVTPFGEDEDRSQISVRVRLEDNFTLAEASREMERYEAIVTAHAAELGHDHVSARFDDQGGELSLYWDEPLSEERAARTRRELEALLPRLPGHELRFYGEEQVDTRSRSLVTFQILGPDHETLQALGARALARLERVPGLSQLETPASGAPRQVRVELDVEKAWQLGVTADIALQNIAWALRGFSLPRFQEPGRELPFYVEYDEEQVAGLSTLRDLSIFTGTGPVALSSVADLDFARAPDSIYRHNGRAVFNIVGRVDDPNRQLEVSRAGYEALRELELPRGFALGDETSVGARQIEEIQEMKNALMFSIVLVFLLMSILFESLVKPFAVLFTIPFAMVGAYWTLYLTGTAMDSVGYIGLIILVGVVVNNGIVLIDRIDRLHAAGLERREAVLEGGASRVRPILMTACTTVFGLFPMVLAEPPSQGIDYRALGTCVAGGLALSTFFTLWVVPLAYTIVLDLWEALRGHAAAGSGVVLARLARRAPGSGARA